MFVHRTAHHHARKEATRNTMTNNPARFTTKQAAQAIGVSKETLLRWLYEGLVREPARDRRGWRVWTQKEIDRIATWNSATRPGPMRQPEPQGAR